MSEIVNRTPEEVWKLWLDALRSGEYKPGRGQLRTVNERFCCLGVLCDLAAKDGGRQWSDPATYSCSNPSYNYEIGNTSYPPTIMMYYLGITEHAMSVIAIQNDAHVNSNGKHHFSIMADWLETKAMPAALRRLSRRKVRG